MSTPTSPPLAAGEGASTPLLGDGGSLDGGHSVAGGSVALHASLHAYSDGSASQTSALTSGRGGGGPGALSGSVVLGSGASEPGSLAPSGGAASGGRTAGRTLAVIPSSPRGSDKSDPAAGLAKAPSAGTAASTAGSVGEGAGAGTKRSLGVVGLALMAYLTVCAGPYSIEEAVAAGGPGPTLLGVCLLGVLWGLPQSLITAELSCMMDVNGSYVLWVERGLGPLAAWVSSFNSALSNTCDLPLYCILLSQYVNSLVLSSSGTPLPVWALLALRGATLAVMLGFNIRGLHTVAGAGLVMVLAMLTPFALQPMVGWAQVQPDTWVQALPAGDIQWATLTATLLWNFQGWDSCGAWAGEVRDAKRTYVAGISLALAMTVVTYLVPVAANAGVNRNWGAWEDGSLASMAASVAPWLGVWVVVGAVLAQLGNGLTMLAGSSRVLWQMAHRRMLPPALGWSSPTFGTPVAALVAQTVTTAVLMCLLDFSTLVLFDTFFNNISLLLETAAFLRLRYTEANTHRPFTVPGGMPVAWGLTLAKGAVLLFAFATVQTWHVWAIAAGANILVLAAYAVVTGCRRADLQQSSGTLQPADEAALLLAEV